MQMGKGQKNEGKAAEIARYVSAPRPSGVTQLGQREQPRLPQTPVCGAGPKLLGATRLT